jgi:ATP-dependent Clp protease protease subunit
MKIKNFDPNRAIFLFDNIHNESSEKVVKSLVELSSESEDDIFLFINSYGGSVIALFAILDAIKSIKNNVNTIVFGEADSAAAVLSSSGIKGKRYIGENSRTMIHEVSGMVFGTISEIKNQIEGAKEMQDKLVNILSANTSKSIDEINELIDGKDFFMTAEESVNFGMADTIITSKQEEIIEELFEVSIAASGEKNISIQNCSIDKLSDFYNNIKRMIGSNYSKKDDIAKTQDVVNEDVSDTTKEIKEDEDSLINNKKKENDMSTKTDELNLNDILSRITELTNSNKDLQEKYASISN